MLPLFSFSGACHRHRTPQSARPGAAARSALLLKLALGPHMIRAEPIWSRKPPYIIVPLLNPPKGPTHQESFSLKTQDQWGCVAQG